MKAVLLCLVLTACGDGLLLIPGRYTVTVEYERDSLAPPANIAGIIERQPWEITAGDRSVVLFEQQEYDLTEIPGPALEARTEHFWLRLLPGMNSDSFSGHWTSSYPGLMYVKSYVEGVLDQP